MRDYQIGFIDGLVYALNLQHLPIDEAYKIINEKLDELHEEL